jgi:hypothetical protein
LLIPELVSALIINFHDHNNPKGATQEVWINPGKGVEMRSKADGTVQYVARLSHILPEAISTNTPIKSMPRYLPLLAKLTVHKIVEGAFIAQEIHRTRHASILGALMQFFLISHPRR